MLKELQWDGMGSLMLKELPAGWHMISHAYGAANGMAYDLSCFRSSNGMAKGSFMLKVVASGMAWDLSGLRSCQWDGI